LKAGIENALWFLNLYDVDLASITLKEKLTQKSIKINYSTQ
jgi:hypothetical protein